MGYKKPIFISPYTKREIRHEINLLTMRKSEWIKKAQQAEIRIKELYIKLYGPEGRGGRVQLHNRIKTKSNK